jgi:hypothetical protein
VARGEQYRFLESVLRILPKESVMSLKSLLTAATLITSSTAAFASPVTLSANASFSYGDVHRVTVAPVYGAHLTVKPVIKPMPPIYVDDCNNTTLGGDSSSYVGPIGGWTSGWMALTQPTRLDRGREFIHVGPQYGRFNTLKLESTRGASFINQVAIQFADGKTQVVHLNEGLSGRNPCITIDLTGRNRQINGIVVYGSTNARSSYQILAA